MLGVIDLSNSEIESVEVIKQRVKKALKFVDPQNIILAPDCGMKYLSRKSSFGKLKNMVQAATELRKEFE